MNRRSAAARRQQSGYDTRKQSVNETGTLSCSNWHTRIMPRCIALRIWSLSIRFYCNIPGPKALELTRALQMDPMAAKSSARSESATATSSNAYATRPRKADENCIETLKANHNRPFSNEGQLVHTRSYVYTDRSPANRNLWNITTGN